MLTPVVRIALTCSILPIMLLVSHRANRKFQKYDEISTVVRRVTRGGVWLAGPHTYEAIHSRGEYFIKYEN